MPDIERIKEWIGKTSWYHIIELAPGLFTPGLQSLVPQWDMMRTVRNRIDYAGKTVLDIASYDGQWSFEAEKLGAAAVVAADCIHLPAYRNFLFARECLRSNVLPYYNVAPHNLFDRLDVFLDDHGQRFDIVHHLGLLYHLRDPLLSLSHARSCLKDGGTLWLETSVVTGGEGTYARFNGLKRRIYSDHTTWWSFGVECLCEMLQMSLFDVDSSSITIMPQGRDIGRCCLTAKARAADESNVNDRELWRTSRNPGLNLDRRWMRLP